MTVSWSPEHRSKRLRALGFSTNFYSPPVEGVIEDISFSGAISRKLPYSLPPTPPDMPNFNAWPNLCTNGPSRSQTSSVPAYRNERLPFALPEENITPSGWDVSFLDMTCSGMMPPFQDTFPFPTTHEDSWDHDQYGDALGLNTTVTDSRHDFSPMTVNDENALQLNFDNPRPHCPPLTLDTTAHSRSPSGSSLSASSGGPSLFDYPSVTSFDPNSFTFPAKPAQPSSTGVVRHARTSSSPRGVMRSAPYSIRGNRTPRWSIGTDRRTPVRRRSSSLCPTSERCSSHTSPNASFASSSGSQAFGQSAPARVYETHCQVNPVSHSASYSDLFPIFPPTDQTCEASTQSFSHGPVPTLQSNAGSACQRHYDYTDLSSPPDLFAPLSDEQSSPPPEDMKPDDADMVPYEQGPRFEGDLYAPKWVRGQGTKREGWCGFCKPGRWLLLKNSAFGYDKRFSHGVRADTGDHFEGPQATRPLEGNPDTWEGLCGCCNEWIALVSSKKKGTTWFRHAYNCQAKDSPKRKKEDTGSRTLTGVAAVESSYQTPASIPQTPPTLNATPGSRVMASPCNTISPLNSLTRNII